MLRKKNSFQAIPRSKAVEVGYYAFSIRMTYLKHSSAIKDINFNVCYTLIH
jgi:hypothetical protein